MRKRDRVFALVVAGTFLVSTLAVSGAVIWQLIEEGKNPETTDTTQPETEQDNANKLEGKQMDNFTPVAKIETLERIDTQPGDGETVKAGDTVTVDYTGAVAATGQVFQSSLDFGQPVTFALDEVIAGWKEGLVGMKVNGKRRLLIPAAQAYGPTPPQGSNIPADADLVFDITLHKIGE
jgi:FKBP-type peptidyl-prolyl cis-trans isomerase